MKVLVTGANGFIGQNLTVQLRERRIEVLTHSRSDDQGDLSRKLEEVDFVFHLAGVNRPKAEQEFEDGNVGFTRMLCSAIESSGRLIPILYTSSIQASQSNPYGRSKCSAENVLRDLSARIGISVYVFRLPNVFGKWCRPNYNSVVATFCHNIAHGLPIQINNPAAEIDLVYVDDVVAEFIRLVEIQPQPDEVQYVQPVYQISVGKLAERLYAFKASRESLIIDDVGAGLTRALYSTFISYFAPAQFSYALAKHEDQRGVFVEMLKTRESGQISYFTAHPGVTRGGHYHHTKNEKFLVVKGAARFRFRQVNTGESYEIYTSSEQPQVVETVPGWAHDITNIGDDEMIVMLWANEIFDKRSPDTIGYKV